MPIAPPEVRQAKAVLKAHRQAAKPARGKPKAPKHKNAPTRKKDPVFSAWIRRQPCAVGPVGCSGRIDPAHVRSHRPGGRPTGMGRKPDDLGNLNPLCRRHHDEQHNAGNEVRWWAGYGKDPHAEAEQHGALYLAECALSGRATPEDAAVLTPREGDSRSGGTPPESVRGFAPTRDWRGT